METLEAKIAKRLKEAQDKGYHSYDAGVISKNFSAIELNSYGLEIDYDEWDSGFMGSESYPSGRSADIKYNGEEVLRMVNKMINFYVPGPWEKKYAKLFKDANKRADLKSKQESRDKKKKLVDEAKKWKF